MESIHNFRDFGGYRTQDGSRIKEGLLFRSGSLAAISDDNMQQLSELGIRTIYDLRSHREQRLQPDGIPNNWDGRYLHIPINGGMQPESGHISQLYSVLFGEARKKNFSDVAVQAYRNYVTDYHKEYAEIINLTSARENLPILIHCTAGKDRTGFACSLIQLLLGMSFELILLDYLHTNDQLYEFKQEMEKKLRFLSVVGVSKEKFTPLFEARSEYLMAAYDQIRLDYGTIDGYLREGLSFSHRDRQRLENTLLENVGEFMPNLMYNTEYLSMK
jgi:protein-tyrosine phosphatase